MMKQATRWSFILTAIVTLFIIVFLRWQGASLTKPATPLGILALEFANTPDKLAPVLQSWMGRRSLILIFVLTFFLLPLTQIFFFSLLEKPVGNGNQASPNKSVIHCVGWHYWLQFLISLKIY